jgi:dihydrofolate reductase
MKKFDIILATDTNGGISFKNKLPWRLKKDMIFFSEITTNNGMCLDNNEEFKFNQLNDYGYSINNANIVIMGRKTWESIGSKPLKNRINFIVSSSYEVINIEWNMLKNNMWVKAFPTFEKAYIEACNETKYAEKSRINVIGGSGIYGEAFKHSAFNKVYLTKIDGVFETDVNIDAASLYKNVKWLNTFKYETTDVDKNTGVSYPISFNIGKNISHSQ